MRRCLNHLTVAVGLAIAGSTPMAIAAPIEGPRSQQPVADSAPDLASTCVEELDALRTAVQSYLDALHEDGDFPGVSLGIALPDGSTLHLASGVADQASRAPLSEDSRFLAGSVGKTFFSALALQLAEEGRLELDAPISRFLGSDPWFDRLPNARYITVRMLLNHTSGLVRYEFDPRVAEAITTDPDKVWTGEDRLAYLLDTMAPFAAGEDWTYSDTNYIVLAMILERITGTEAYSEIRRRFIEPLGLRNTVPSDRRAIDGLIQGYAGPDNPFGGRELMLEGGRLIFDPQLEWAGGGYASSPVDLAVWGRALFSGRLHGEDVPAQLVEGVPTTNPNLRYGLGAMIQSTDLGPSWGHGGFFPGYLSEMRYYPKHDLGVAVQFNTSVPSDLGSTPGNVAHEVARLVVEHLPTEARNHECDRQ
jgi:D-alanyl-D-alanine carboxypeptidase